MGKVISEHLFIFPFSWKYGRGNDSHLFSQHNELKRKKFGRFDNWREHFSIIETSEDYNEYVYFYKPIRSALYTFAGKPVIVRNYTYDALDETKKILLVVRNKSYDLTIEKIDLKLYKTGIGLLCFQVLNTDYQEEEAIGDINALSCCVYPPIMPIEKARARGFPTLVEMTLNQNTTIREDFLSPEYKQCLTISPLIMAVLGKPFTSTNRLPFQQGIVIEPILGHQMFCCCMYYGAGDRMQFKSEKQIIAEIEKWMHFSYFDGDKKEWKNEAVKPYVLMSNHQFYGMSRKMFFGLTYCYPCERLYDQLVKLVLMQRATLLNLSTEIARVSTLPKDEISSAISSIYEIYIQFINQLYFKEVTEDGEGSLLYEQLSKIFKIEEELAQLNGEVDEVHEYALLVEQSVSNIKVQFLTIIGAALVLPSFVTGFFGMNIFQQEALHWWRHQTVALWLNSYVFLPILLVVALCSWTKRKTPFTLLLKVILCILLLTSLSFTLKYGCGL